MTDFLRNIDCLVLETYKYTRTSASPSLDLIQMELAVYLKMEYGLIIM